MKHQPRTCFLSLAAVLGGAAFLAACAGDPVYVACPSITAPPEGTSAFRKMDVTGEVVDVRMNGARGLCQSVDGGKQVDVAIGLKMKRPAAEKFAGGVTEVEIVSFVIDSDDNVVSSDSTLYKTDPGWCAHPLSACRIFDGAGGRPASCPDTGARALVISENNRMQLGARRRRLLVQFFDVARRVVDQREAGILVQLRGDDLCG